MASVYKRLGNYLLQPPETSSDNSGYYYGDSSSSSVIAVGVGKEIDYSKSKKLTENELSPSGNWFVYNKNGDRSFSVGFSMDVFSENGEVLHPAPTVSGGSGGTVISISDKYVYYYIAGTTVVFNGETLVSQSGASTRFFVKVDRQTSQVLSYLQALPSGVKATYDANDPDTIYFIDYRSSFDLVAKVSGSESFETITITGDGTNPALHIIKNGDFSAIETISLATASGPIESFFLHQQDLVHAQAENKLVLVTYEHIYEINTVSGFVKTLFTPDTDRFLSPFDNVKMASDGYHLGLRDTPTLYNLSGFRDSTSVLYDDKNKCYYIAVNVRGSNFPDRHYHFLLKISEDGFNENSKVLHLSEFANSQAYYSSFPAIALDEESNHLYVLVSGFQKEVGEFTLEKANFFRINSDFELDTSSLVDLIPSQSKKEIASGLRQSANGGGVALGIIVNKNEVSAVYAGTTYISGGPTYLYRIKPKRSEGPYKNVYTVPVGKSAIVSNFIVSNHNAFPVYYDIAVVPSSTNEILPKHHFVWDNLLEANSFEQHGQKVTLSAGDKVYVYSSTDENISINIFGAEL